MEKEAVHRSFPDHGNHVGRPESQAGVQKVPWDTACILILKDKELASRERERQAEGTA